MKAKEVIFSPIQGTLILDRKPVSGARLERTAKWDETSFVDMQTSNDKGQFTFPVISRDRHWLSWLLPSEPFVEQTIEATYNGKNFKIWFHMKRSWSLNSENNGKPIRIECNLDQEPKRRNDVFGLCDFV